MKKPKRIYLVVDGEEILYRTKRAHLARTFQNACGRPSAQMLRTRVEWREPYREGSAVPGEAGRGAA